MERFMRQREKSGDQRWIRKIAYWPVHLTSGLWVWLEITLFIKSGMFFMAGKQLRNSYENLSPELR